MAKSFLPRIASEKNITANLAPTTEQQINSFAQALPAAEHSQTGQDGQTGRDFYEAGQFAAAAESWAQAAANFAAQGDSLNQASMLSYLALAYQKLGDVEQSESAIAQSLALISPEAITLTNAGSQPRSEISHSELSQRLAQIHNTHGNLRLLRSQPTEALEAFKTATTYYTQTSDNAGLLRSQLNQTQALQALGFYRRALINLTDITPPLAQQPNSITKVTGLQMLGDLYRTTGDLDAAQTTLELGLEIAEGFSGQEISGQQAIAAVQLSLGHTAEAKGDTTQALTYYQTVIATARESASLDSSSARPSLPQSSLLLKAQLSQLALLQNADNNDLSLPNAAQQINTLITDIQQTLETLPTDRLALNGRLDLARQQLDQSQLSNDVAQQMIQSLAIALQQATALGDPRAESYALGYLGELYRQQQQYSDAQQVLAQALTLAETLQAPDLAYQWQWQLGLLARQQKDTTVAITHYDNAVESLQALRGNLRTITPDLRFNFREKVEPIYRDLVDLLLDDASAVTAGQGDAQPQLIKARQAIESLQIAEVENFFQEPCVAISQQIDQIIENTASPTAVVYPIILPDRLEIILKLPQQPLQLFSSQVDQLELEQLLTQFQTDLRLPFTINAVQSESAQLYDWLIAPIEPALSNSQIDTLVFVLDGFLRSIPMAALYDRQQYLVEKYSIALAPGLQLVDPQPLSNKSLSTLIAGLSEPRHGFSALPSVQDEVTQVQQNTDSQVLLNESFTQNNLVDAINNTPYPLVHLATHGQFSSDPAETFVLAWDKPIQVNELNRLLRQSEQSRRGAIELLILSACETAAGDKRAALGLAGVAVQAGARSTLASLWSLDDETGALFSDYFYQALQSPGISKAQAVRQAQLQLLGEARSPNSPYQHPRYWAPYILLGNWL
ncbi:MAG: CHAT domain-containing protein [Cyanobacteria bacterium J06597_16]